MGKYAQLYESSEKCTWKPWLETPLHSLTAPTSFTPIRLTAFSKPVYPGPGEDVVQQELPSTAGGNRNLYKHFEKSFSLSNKE